MSDYYKTKIGIFLGSFDPFHLGHKGAVEEALRRGLNEVWVVPSVWNPWKDWQPVPIDERFWIAHYELEKVEGARVLVVTTDPDPTDGKYYSVDQLRKIIRGYGSRGFEFWLIGGKDVTSEIENWKEGSWILGNFKTMEIEFNGGEHTEETKISSTQIREWIKNREWGKLKGILCPKSIKYIKNHELYI
jgi:cytidyltransferase-like protein